MGGQLCNDINILTKHIIFARNEIATVGAQDGKSSAAIAQLLLMLKLLAGRPYEGQKMINKTFSSTKLQKKYAAEMTGQTMDNLQKLNAYFGRENIIKTIRARFAFHLDESEISDVYNAMQDEFAFDEYLSPQYAGHNLFGSAETLCMNAIVGANNVNWRPTIDSFVLDVTTISVLMGTFLSGFLGLMLKKYIGLSGKRMSDTAFVIEDDPAADTVRLPFFCSPPSRID